MPVSMYIFFVGMSSVWAAAHWWVWKRTLPANASTAARRALGIGLLVHYLLTLSVFMARDADPNLALVRSYKTLGYLALGAFTTLVALLALRDLLIDLPLWLRDRFRERPCLAPAGGPRAEHGTFSSPVVADADGPRNPGRRAFLRGSTSAAAAVVTLGATGRGYANATRFPDVKRVEVRVADLHPDLEGMTIVQLTDVHMGPTVGPAFLERLVDVTNGLSPDLVAITGDLVDGWVRDIGDWIQPLDRLEAPLGSFYVTGNHEYYWDGPAWVERVAQTGVVPLVNTHQVVQRGGARVAVAGVTDIQAGEMAAGHAHNPDAALGGVPEGAFRLVLAHQPNSIYRVSELGAELQLSGHTHGGQWYPWTFVVGWVHAFAVGLHRMRDTQIYVSRGTAYWGPPMRLGAPAEITHLTLRGAS